MHATWSERNERQPAAYLRDARVGGVQEVAEERVAVVRADGGGGVWEEVVVEQAFPKELVEDSGGVAQGTSEPGVLNGNIHNDLAWLDVDWRCLAGVGGSLPCCLDALGVSLNRVLLENKSSGGRFEEAVERLSEWTRICERRVLPFTVAAPSIYIHAWQKEGLTWGSRWNGISSWWERQCQQNR